MSKVWRGEFFPARDRVHSQECDVRLPTQIFHREEIEVQPVQDNIIMIDRQSIFAYDKDMMINWSFQVGGWVDFPG